MAACDGDAADDQLVAMREHAGRGMAEEQAAVHLAVARDDRHGEIAAHRQMALGHAVIRRGLAVVRMGQHVVDPHGAFAAERRAEQRRRTRHREVRERLARRARQRVQHERVAVGLLDVVEERAELRAGQLDRRVGDCLHHALQVEVARQRHAGPVQDLPLLAPRRAGGLRSTIARSRRASRSACRRICRRSAAGWS